MDKYVVLSKNGKLFLHSYVSCYFYMLMLLAICLFLRRCEQSYFAIKCLIGTPIHTFIQYTMTKLIIGARKETEISPSKLSVITKTNSCFVYWPHTMKQTPHTSDEPSTCHKLENRNVRTTRALCVLFQR